ncbi:MAG: tyrosine-type recombinase/integrase [Anaerolineae bacterium]|nr:tyrosine-type recombinase/integrase [Phycisphaerae bacterium]
MKERRLGADPFDNVSRSNIRKAAKKRARRALEDAESFALIDAAREDRQLKYMFAMLAGLRREYLVTLTWGDVKLNAPIPFIQLHEEQTKNAHSDVLPLHPRLVTVLKALPEGMPAKRVVDSVPDVKTLVKDLRAAGVAPVDERGRRVDYHALRHTFATNLDRTGSTRATKKALMRHADADVTDGYSHAHLAEMHAAVCRLPDPMIAIVKVESAIKTGTSGEVSGNLRSGSHTGHGSDAHRNTLK